MSIENLFPHWLSSSISSSHSPLAWDGEWAGAGCDCQMSAHVPPTLIMSHVTSFVPNQSRLQTWRQLRNVLSVTLHLLLLLSWVHAPCKYSCVCGMIPHFPVAPADYTWLLVPPIQSWVPSVMFWLTSMSRRSPEYQVPTLISSLLMPGAGAGSGWHSDSRCAGVIAPEFPQLAMI